MLHKFVYYRVQAVLPRIITVATVDFVDIAAASSTIVASAIATDWTIITTAAVNTTAATSPGWHDAPRSRNNISSHDSESSSINQV